MKNRRVKLHKNSTKSEDNVYIELDTKCSCSPSSASDHASIQFARRYLECQGSMPIRILRSYIEQVLPHSPMTQVSIYDSNDRLLNDSVRLKDLPSSSIHIPLRFTMMNTVTSFGHCLCSSPSSSSSVMENSSSFSPTIIRRETINRTLSTCPLVPTPPHSPSSFTSTSPILSTLSMPTVNLLTPPSPKHYSSFFIDSLVETNAQQNQSIIDQITSEFGEICSAIPPLKGKRPRVFKKLMPKSTLSDIPLDLSVKKRPTSFDLFSQQPKWLKMI